MFTNTRLTFGAVLGTIGSVANAATKTVGTTVRLVDMADDWVESVQQDQKKRIIASSEMSDHRLATELAMEAAELDQAVTVFRTKSADHEKHFDRHYNAIMGALEKHKGAKTSAP